MAATRQHTNGTNGHAPGLSAGRLRALRAHRDWLRQIAEAAGPFRARQVHAGELRAYAQAVADLVDEVERLRGEAAL